MMVNRRLGVIAGSVFLLAGLFLDPASARSPDTKSHDSVRKELEAMYRDWGRARVHLDRKTIERILADDFFVLLDGERIARDDFVETVTQARTDFTLTRFDADILTLQETGDDWTVVITEKLEVEFIDDQGVAQKGYSFWVTRDGCRKTGDQWQVTYSEAIGYERWRQGAKPPFSDW